MKRAALLLTSVLGWPSAACGPESSVYRWRAVRVEGRAPDAGVSVDMARSPPSSIDPPPAGSDAGSDPEDPGREEPAVMDAAAPDSAPDLRAVARDAPPPPPDAAPPAPPPPRPQPADAAVPDLALDTPPPADASIPCGTAPCKRVFVTAGSMPNGGFGSVGTGDRACQRVADGAALGGTWRAWLSNVSTSPATRFVQSAFPYRLLDGTQVAADWRALTSGVLENPIDVMETGRRIPAGVVVEVWTGTTPSGRESGITCANWTNPSPGLPDGQVGLSSRRDRLWTQALAELCSTSAHLYCFEQ
jgi:hypothetical protein